MKVSRTTTLFEELNTMKKDSKKYQTFLNKRKDENNFSSLHEYLNDYLSQNPTLTIPDIITRSNLSKNYVYPIFNGTRIPSKYKLVALCIGARMSLKDTQRALALANCASLHPKNPADAGIIICINNECTCVREVCEFLDENGVEIPFE